MLGRLRRGHFGTSDRAETGLGTEPALAATVQPSAEAIAGWDRTVSSKRDSNVADGPPLRARVLSLFSDPRLEGITAHAAARALDVPLQDVQTVLDAMVQAGDLTVNDGPFKRYQVDREQKARLEWMFRDAAGELGEQGAMVASQGLPDALASFDDDTEEPRLPVTAGLLSLFLPGTGQLLNGDVGRASLVFAVWSLAWITHLSPVCAFVQLYAGAEAFFTAKIRSMERRLAREAASRNAIAAPTARALPPKVASS